VAKLIQLYGIIDPQNVLEKGKQVGFLKNPPEQKS
jgi:hypothetical protein